MRNTLVKKIAFFALILILLCGACACEQTGQVSEGETQPQEEEKAEDTGPVRGGTLTLQSYNADTLHPLLTKSNSNIQVLGLIYDSLITFDDQLNVVPGLAESWQVSDDGMTWTFQLRKDVKWHDGTGLTANDVDFTFKAINDKRYDSVYQYNTQSVTRFEVVDEYTFRVVLNRPYGGFIRMMYFPVLPKHQLQGLEIKSVDQDFKPIGTGPYRFAEYTPMKEIKLKASDTWWKDQSPYIDEVIVRLMPDNQTALYALEAKEADFVVTDVVDWKKYNGKENIRTKEFLTGAYEFIGVNFNHNVLSDKAVRKAMAYAIDRETIIDEVLLGHARLSDVPMMPGTALYDESAYSYWLDREKAIELLNQAGWTDSDNDGVLDKEIEGVVTPLAFELVTNNENMIREKSAEMIAAHLKDIGMNVTLKKAPWDDLKEMVDTKNFDAVLTGFDLAPSMDLSFAFHSEEIERGTNFISYRNAEMDDLLFQTFRAVDAAQSKQAYAKLQKLIVEDVPYISLYFRTSAVIYNGRLRGDINPISTNLYNDINKWYLLQQ
ncbi:MAG: peptide ABC transporter substrate-binding protein [Firmicutes bacterium]|nr:peptide ABC transporter substrate-binding protein [Bacillota bacterium]